MLVTRVGSLVYSCLRSVVISWVVVVDQQKNWFDISPTHPDSVSRHCFHPSGNHFILDLYGLSDTLPILSKTVTILSGSTSQDIMVQNVLFGI